MRCTLESKRGDGGKMKNKKEGLFIQCIVCSLLPLITLFIPYLKFGISVPLLGKVMEQLTGMDLLKVMGNVNNLANSELADYLGSDFFSGIKIYYFDGTCDFCDSANIIYCFCSDAWSGNEKRAVYKDTCYHAGTCLNF